MDLTVALDLRYSMTPDGCIWSEFGMARQFWGRYLEVFDRVKVVARVRQIDYPREGWLPVEGENISVHAVPDFHGPLQCLMRYPSVRASVRSAVAPRGAIILRVGSQIANMLENSLLQGERPYALEVVGDPYEVFAPGSVRHPLRPFLRWHFSRQLQRQCRRAAGVKYVTRCALQKRYPTTAPVFSASDVDLPDEAFARAPKPGINKYGPLQIVTVGALTQYYKGTDVLIDALARCVQTGCDVTAVIVGDGKYRHDFVSRAERAGIASRIQFLGHVPAGDAVRQILDSADLFVMPSRTEGLPRALIEAMARGLPCIASDVGGIPELLDAADLVPPGDSASLSNAICSVWANPQRMAVMSDRNLVTARNYATTLMWEGRRRFYRFVYDSTLAWESGRRT